jgi:hypothetical protein
MFTFLKRRLEDKNLWTEWQKAFPEFNLLLISSWIQFCFVTSTVISKNLNFATFLKNLLGMILSYILVTRCEYILSLLCIYF